MEKTIEYLKQNLRYYRKQANLTQQKLAEKCSISTTYVAEIELGRKYPSLRTLIKFSIVFDIPVYMLLIDSDNYQNVSIDLFSRDLEKGIRDVIKDLKKRY